MSEGATNAGLTEDFEALKGRGECLICEKAITPSDHLIDMTFHHVTGPVHALPCAVNCKRSARLPEFTGLDRKCPKCHGTVDTVYQQLGWKNHDLGLPTERLLRACNRCGYSWGERTAAQS